MEKQQQQLTPRCIVRVVTRAPDFYNTRPMLLHHAQGADTINGVSRTSINKKGENKMETFFFFFLLNSEKNGASIRRFFF
jgi:hypothetical protein